MTVRFGLIGTNFVTDWLIAGGRESPNFEATAIYSRTAETAAAFAAKHSIPHIFLSLEEMCSSSLIDAVYIASPNFCHYAQCLMAVSHRKHVLCEKPLATTAREARAMIKAARDHGVVLMEAMRPTVTPNFLLLQKNLPRVGTVRRYFASYCQYSSRYDKLKEGVVLNAWRPELGNGSTMDIGVYTLYPMVVLFGRPRSVHADAVMLSTGVDGQCVVTFVYDGFQGTAVYGKIADSFLPTEIQGESGNIIADRIHVIKDLKFIPRAPDRFAERHEEALAVVHDHHEFFYEVQEFCNLVIGGKLESENNSLENSLIIMECIDEIRKQIGLVYPADSADIPE